MKKNTFIKLSVSLLLCLLLISCASQSDQEVMDIEIYPYNYQYQEGKDGWNNGFLSLYAANTSDSVVSYENIAITNATIETKEEISYSAELYSFHTLYVDQYTLYNNVYQHQDLPLNIQIPLLPSGFPMVLHKTYDYQYILMFRFAKAATPIKLTIETSNGRSDFILDEIPRDLPSPNAAYNPLTTFASDENSYNESYNLTFSDRCYFDNNSNYSISYKITNNDIYNELKFLLPGAYSIYYNDGSFFHSGLAMISETIGPDQTLIGAFEIPNYGQIPTYLIRYEADNNHNYILSCTPDPR